MSRGMAFHDWPDAVKAAGEAAGRYELRFRVTWDRQLMVWRVRTALT